MQRLNTQMAGKPFTILAVNMAEDDAVVRAFIDQKAKVNFTVLMDRDGAALRDWKVFVFPTSFLLGPGGEIRFGAYGELRWDSEEVVNIIEGLLPAH
jgi:hypothetical protein